MAIVLGFSRGLTSPSRTHVPIFLTKSKQGPVHDDINMMGLRCSFRRITWLSTAAAPNP